MERIDMAVKIVVLLAAVVATSATACSSSSPASGANASIAETNPRCLNGTRDGDEAGVDCGGGCVKACGPDEPDASVREDDDAGGGINGKKDGRETDVDCGGDSGVKCKEGQRCLEDDDCEVVCNYANTCVSTPSCKPHLGGDTCGLGEVGEPWAQHESCCRSLEVKGYTDPTEPGKKVYLDKYEITAGRIRSFVEQMAAKSGGKPDVKRWIRENRPKIWDEAWDVFLPSDYEGETVVIERRLLGDPRIEDGIGSNGPGVILPPATDEPRDMGIHYQFGSELYVDLHGNNCATYPDSWGFPTYYYPAEILARDDQLPRVDGKTSRGEVIPAKDLLDVKSMNCITNAMLAAFCAWDGGQLATDEVLDYVTDTPDWLGNTSGCGEQHDDHDALLGNSYARTVQEGGRCAPVRLVNATFDGGDDLPVPNSPLNVHNYHYPDTGNATHDKAWEISAPGRASLAADANGAAVDAVRIRPEDEPWMDLNGNLNEAALDMSGEDFTGNFSLKYRGIAYGSARSDLNVKIMRGESLMRIQRPEAKAAYTGGRCMRFR